MAQQTQLCPPLLQQTHSHSPNLMQRRQTFWRESCKFSPQPWLWEPSGMVWTLCRREDVTPVGINRGGGHGCAGWACSAPLLPDSRPFTQQDFSPVTPFVQKIKSCCFFASVSWATRQGGQQGRKGSSAWKNHNCLSSYVYLYIYKAIYKLHGNHKSKIYDKYRHSKEKGIQRNTKDSHQITREGNKRRRKEQKELFKKQKKISKMLVSTYLTTTTLNVNGVNAPIKRQRVAEWIQNKTHIYVAYKRLISDVKTHKDWKWGNGKSYSMQMEIKRKLG